MMKLPSSEKTEPNKMTRTAWLVSTDLEVVYPLRDGYLREPYKVVTV
jgi:hypothetical protein